MNNWFIKAAVSVGAAYLLMKKGYDKKYGIILGVASFLISPLLGVAVALILKGPKAAPQAGGEFEEIVSTGEVVPESPVQEPVDVQTLAKEAVEAEAFDEPLTFPPAPAKPQLTLEHTPAGYKDETLADRADDGISLTVNPTGGEPVTVAVAEGSSSPKFCENCGAPLTPGAKFCENCGTKI